MYRFKEVRKESHLSQKELSQILKISQSIICDYENERSQPTAPIIIAYADYFNVSADYLLGRTDY